MIFRFGSTPRQNVAFMKTNKALMLTTVIALPIILFVFCIGFAFMPFAKVIEGPTGETTGATIVGGVLYEHIADSPANTGVWIYARTMTDNKDEAKVLYDEYIEKGFGDNTLGKQFTANETTFHNDMVKLGGLSKAYIAFCFACLLVVLVSFLALIASKNYVLALKITMNVGVLFMLAALIFSWFSCSSIDNAVRFDGNLPYTAASVDFLKAEIATLYAFCLAAISALAFTLSFFKRKFNKKIQQAKFEMLEEKMMATPQSPNDNTANEVFGNADNSAAAQTIAADTDFPPKEEE